MYVRRASFVLAIALAALAAPSARAAQQAAQASTRGPNQWALLVGIEDGAGATALQLRADLDFPQRALSSAVDLSIVGSIGYSRYSKGYNDFFSGQRLDHTLNLFKVIPAARFTFLPRSSIRPYADAGIGIYYGSARVDYVAPNGFTASASDSNVGVTMRFAAGVTFQASPGFALGVELGFNPYFSHVPDDTFTSLLGSATFRM